MGDNTIQAGNDTGLSICHICHIGIATISLSYRQFLHKQLLHVPLICKNLIFVSKVAHDNNVFFEFHASYFVIKYCQSEIPLHECQLSNGLYNLDHSPPSTIQKQALVGEKTSAHHWHRCMGHPAFHIVHHVLSKFHLPVSNNKDQAP
jgi:hypothetical protein